MASCANTGRQVVRYPDGKLRRVVSLVYGTQHGPFVAYHPNGKVGLRGRYANGLPDGEFVTHDSNGTLVKREIYRAGRLVWTSTKELERPPADFEPGPLPPFRPATTSPEFVTLSRLSSTDRVSLQVGTLRLRGAIEDGVGQLYNLYGQFARDEWIIYGQGSVGWARFGDATQASKLVVEGGVGRRFPVGPHEGQVRLGLAAPVRHDDMDGFVGRAQLVYDRLTDTALSYPRTVAVRSGFSLLGRRDWLLFRADAGFDVAAGLGDGEVGAAAALQPIGYVNVGGGLGDENISMTLELVNVANLADDRPDERFAHSFAITGMIRRWSVQPQIGLITPLDPAFFTRTFSIIAGVQYEP